MFYELGLLYDFKFSALYIFTRGINKKVNSGLNWKMFN